MLMKKSLLVLSIIVISLAMTGSLCFGAGFALYEASAKGNALGGLTGSADCPSAMFYNPAGITQLEGLQLSGGGIVILPTADITTKNPYTGVTQDTSMKDNTWVIPHLYATYQAFESVWFGLAVFSRFGLGSEYDDTWWGRYNNYKAVIKTVTANPNVAWKINDVISVAGGLDVMKFDLQLRNKINASLFTPAPNLNPASSDYDVDSSLSGDSYGVGYNLAVHIRPLDWLRVGVSYRSKVKQDVKGSVDFVREGAMTGYLPAEWFNSTGANGSITLPDMLFLGVSLKPIDRLMVELGGTYTRWSSYDQLTLNYDRPLVEIPGHLSLSSVTIPKNWKDVWRFNIGVQYQTTSWLDLRVSYLYDATPIPGSSIDYIVPADDRHILGFGAGFHWQSWDFDISYNYLMVEDRDVTARPLDGIYDGRIEDGDSHFIGLTVSYRF